MTAPKRTTGIELLVEWANAQDNWVRAIVTAVLQSRQALSDSSIDAAYEILLREKRLSPSADSVHIPALGSDQRPSQADQPFRLTALSALCNVNALAADQEITFNPRITVLYGENGAGKSGYVRVLKHLAAVRKRQPILPNISAHRPASQPSGSIAYALGDEEKTYTWSGKDGVVPFTRMDIFDAHGVDLHVDGELTYVYTPTELTVFRYTHDAIESVKRRLEAERDDAQPRGNPYLTQFSRDGRLYVVIETLGATTEIDTLQKISAVAENGRERLDGLKERVDALRSGASDARLNVAREEHALLQNVWNSVAVVHDFKTDAYQHALAELDTATKAHDRASRVALDSEAIPGALGSSWRRFIESGDAYTHEHLGSPYPQRGDSCPYCRQELTAAALELLHKYRTFCHSDLQGHLGTSRTRLDDITSKILELDTSGALSRLEMRRTASDEEPTSHPTVHTSRNVLLAVKRIKETIRARKPLDNEDVSALYTRDARQIGIRLQELEELVADLRSKAQKRSELLATQSRELRDLQDRITLSELLPEILRYVDRSKWASRAGTLLKGFRRVSRGLTDTAKRASETLLNDDFERTFRTECEALKAPPVEVDFPGRRGQPARRKRLSPEYRLTEILSEGEQKVIALADFFAESILRRSASPLVLDDPVSSLDYKRLKYVVDRIVRFSATRQVIVFTHNIWFTMELLQKFDNDRASCTYYDISEHGEEHGIISRGQSPKLDTWNDRKKRINRLIGRITTEGDPEMQAVFTENGYDELRGACEIVVEQDLLQSVVQSYRPNVMVGNLGRISFAKLEEASGGIEEIFDRCCRYTSGHKQPLETLSVRPTATELNEDWRKLQKLRAQVVK